jgi:hypothetical protein
VNKVVVHFADGRIVKGTTADFVPAKDVFHVSVLGAPRRDEPIEIVTEELKALFFVKDFKGDPRHVERNEFDSSHPPVGLRLQVVFKDGEVLVGTTTGYQPNRPGFFFQPADAESNIERCYIVAAATVEVTVL